MKSLSPTQRTLRALREQGLVCAIVEKWNAFGGPHGIRQDLFHIIDILALDPRRGVVGVQSTGQDFAGHFRKLTEERAQECLDWLRTPGTALELWAWRKVKAQRGGKLLLWQPRVRVLTLADFTASTDDATMPRAGATMTVGASATATGGVPPLDPPNAPTGQEDAA